MSLKKDKDLSLQFLKRLSKIKGWHYHEKIETDKSTEIREFISCYILKVAPGDGFAEKISYTRLQFLLNHPAFNPVAKALLNLLEHSDSETDFNERYQKVTI